MKKIASWLLVAGSVVLMTNAYAQGARSLFSNSSGVTFDTSAGAAQNTTKKPALNRPADKSPRNNFTGLSYSILRESASGAFLKVSPKTVFETGDHIRVVVQTNKAGHLSVVNIDPDGKVAVLSEQPAGAGTTLNVPEKGYLKFSGAKGIEQMVFILSAKPLPLSAQDRAKTAVTYALACGAAMVNSRSLVVDDSSGGEFGVVERNGTCAQGQNSTRSLVVEVAEDSGYGVVPDATLGAGQVMTLRIKLRHE